MDQAPTSKKPSIRTVSRVAGVSPTTVSLVLNNSSIPTEKTRLRVLEAIKSTGYRSDPLYSAAFGRKRNGPRGQTAMTSTIGFLTTRLIQQAVSHLDGYYHDALTAVFDTAQKNNYYVMFANAESDDVAIPSIVTGNRIDGLVIQAELESSIKQLLPTRLPVVFIDRVYPEVSADSVVTNYAHATYQMFDYLWNLGHRKIALFTDNTDRYYNDQCHESYRRFYRVKGLALPCPELSKPQDIHPESNEQVYAAYVSRIMAMPSRPTAIVFAANVYALGIISHLQRAGLSVPRDMSVAALCDIMSCQSMDISLTSYQAPMAQIGAAATDLLLQRIADPSRPINKLALNGRMVERTSCSPAPVMP